MIYFDFEKFGREKRYSRQMLSDKAGIKYKTVCLMWTRKSVKARVLKEMEKQIGNLSRYISKSRII